VPGTPASWTAQAEVACAAAGWSWGGS